MNKGYLLGIGIFLSIVVAGLFLLKKPQTGTMPVPPQATQTSVAETEVELSGPVREIEVTGKEYSFNPSSITLKKGEMVKITFKNIGSMTHAFVIEEKIDGKNVRTKVIKPGESDTVEFVVPDVSNLTYYCSVNGHRNLGMEGEFLVIQ